MAFDLSHADAIDEAETLRQELAALRGVEAKLGVAEAELARSEAACATAMAEIEALKQDRAWERDRANEAARLSAEARDRADDLRRQIEALNEQVSIVEGDRTDNDRWAVNLVAEFDLDPNHAIDPYQAIARGLREWRRHVLDAEAELAEAHQRIANLSAQCNRNTEQIGRLQREAAVTEAERDHAREEWHRHNERADHWRHRASRAEEVVETAKAVRELWRYDAMGAAEPEIHAFVAAVDALPTKDGA